MSEPLPVSPALDAACTARDRGWRPFPVDHPTLPSCAGAHGNVPCNGQRGKHPTGGWAAQAASSPSDKLLELWFGPEPRNVGIACGPSGLVVLDEDELGALTSLAARLGETLPATYRVRTARGWHYYFAAPEDQVIGNRAGALAEHHIDVRGGKGGGGYVVGAGSVHVSGHVYTAENPNAPLADLPAWIIDQIQTQPERPDAPAGTGPMDWTDDPRMGNEDELRGQFDRRLAQIQGKGNTFREQLYLAARDGWRLVDCKVLDEHSMLRALKDAVIRVWGLPPDDRDKRIVYDEARPDAQSSPWMLAGGTVIGTHNEVGAPPAGPPTATPPPAVTDDPESSWMPVDLDALWDGSYEPRQADRMFRTDGVGMFYSGLTHSVHGESESGKSWIGQSATVEQLRAGARVLYVDFEDRGNEVLPRLRALGLQREDLARLDYITPEGPADGTFSRLITENDYALAIVDGVTAAMGEYQLKSNAQDDVTAWHKLLPRWIAKHTEAAVVVIDHVAKAKDDRGRFAVGSQAKMAALTGSGFYVDVGTGLAAGRVGELRIYVGKDRPSGVRSNAGKMRKDRLQPFARYVHDATDPSNIRADLVPWLDEESDDNGPAVFALGLDWQDPEQPQVPGDIAAYTGAGTKAIRDLARFLRANGVGGIGVDLAGATTALRGVQGSDGKPRYDRMTISRAWGALFDINRIEPADSNTHGNPKGLHWWVSRPNDPTPS